VGLGLGLDLGLRKWALGLGEGSGLFPGLETVVVVVVVMVVQREWGTRGSSRMESLGLLVETAFLGRIWQYRPLEMVSNELLFSTLFFFFFFFFGVFFFQGKLCFLGFLFATVESKLGMKFRKKEVDFFDSVCCVCSF
jgi:hypothetical protein